MPVPPPDDALPLEPDPSAHLDAAEQARAGTRGVLRSASNRDDFDRSFIAQGLIWIYGGAVACAFLVIIGRSVLLAFQHTDD